MALSSALQALPRELDVSRNECAPMVITSMPPAAIVPQRVLHPPMTTRPILIGLPRTGDAVNMYIRRMASLIPRNLVPPMRVDRASR